MEKKLLSGNEAVARGAWEAGLRVAAAYPGTPSTEILESLAGFKEVDGQWSVNEKVAYEVAYGAALGGVRGLYAGKHVGLNVALDPLMTSVYMGVNAGFVAVTCDDPGLFSSQNEQDTRWVGLYGKIPVIEPSGSVEAHAFVKEAFRLSETFDTPVLFRMTTRTAHAKEDVAVGRRREAVKRKLEKDAGKHVMLPSFALRRHATVEARLEKLRVFSEKSPLNRIEKGSRKLGFIASGVSYQYVRENYPDAMVLKLGMIHPLCEEKIRRFARSVRELCLVEEGDAVLEWRLKALPLKFRTRRPSYRVGELRPEYVPRIVRGLDKDDAPGAARKLSLCRGCPHHFVFHTLKKFPGAFVCGDIGCYTLGALAPYLTLHSCICMGGGVTLAEGLRRARPGMPVIGVIGDSTFIHSGIPGLINAAYNKTKGVILILDNATTAMTGGQEHPGSGFTLKREPTVKLDLTRLCYACGADIVDVISPYRTRELEALIQSRLSSDTLTVIIAQAPCRLLKPRGKDGP